MHVRRAQQVDRLRWDEFVHQHPESTPYHLYAWTSSILDAYGFTSVNLIAEDNNRVVGILPLVKMTIPLVNRTTFVALPYCDVGGVLAENAIAGEMLIQAAVQEAEHGLVQKVELRGGNSAGMQGESCTDLKSYGKVRMLLDLPSTSDELWSGFKSKLRSQINKASKNGLVFDCVSDNVDDFYNVLSTNMRDLGSPVHSKKWFEKIVMHYGDKAKIGLVYHDELPIGAGLILRAGNRISIPWASTLRDFNRLNPNMLLYWKLLKYATDSGCTVFDFGRSTPGEGTYKFKSQWGAIASPLIWQEMVDGKAITLEAQSGSSGGRELVSKIWGKFPLQFSRLIGPVIRKYINL